MKRDSISLSSGVSGGMRAVEDQVQVWRELFPHLSGPASVVEKQSQGRSTLVVPKRRVLCGGDFGSLKQTAVLYARLETANVFGSQKTFTGKSFLEGGLAFSLSRVYVETIFRLEAQQPGDFLTLSVSQGYSMGLPVSETVDLSAYELLAAAVAFKKIKRTALAAKGESIGCGVPCRSNAHPVLFCDSPAHGFVFEIDDAVGLSHYGADLLLHL